MQLIKNYLRFVLSNFRAYRKKIGGKWHYVELIDSSSGIAGPAKYWTQRVDKEEEIIKTENWDQ